jgi:hypothetical protein
VTGAPVPVPLENDDGDGDFDAFDGFCIILLLSTFIPYRGAFVAGADVVPAITAVAGADVEATTGPLVWDGTIVRLGLFNIFGIFAIIAFLIIAAAGSFVVVWDGAIVLLGLFDIFGIFAIIAILIIAAAGSFVVIAAAVGVFIWAGGFVFFGFPLYEFILSAPPSDTRTIVVPNLDSGDDSSLPCNSCNARAARCFVFLLSFKVDEPPRNRASVVVDESTNINSAAAAKVDNFIILRMFQW